MSSDELNKEDHRGNTPLLLSAKLAHKNPDYFRISRLLLNAGADPHKKDKLGWTPLDEALG